MELKNRCEIIGTLKNYIQNTKKLHLVFQIERIIDIPKDALSKHELDNCLYRKIGIINIDGNFKLKKYKNAIDRFKEENCLNCNERESCEKDERNIVYCLIGKINELKNKK